MRVVAREKAALIPVTTKLIRQAHCLMWYVDMTISYYIFFSWKFDFFNVKHGRHRLLSLSAGNTTSELNFCMNGYDVIQENQSDSSQFT